MIAIIATIISLAASILVAASAPAASNFELALAIAPFTASPIVIGLMLEDIQQAERKRTRS